MAQEFKTFITMSSVQSQFSLPGFPDSISLSFPDEAGMLVQTWNCNSTENSEFKKFNSQLSYKPAFFKNRVWSKSTTMFQRQLLKMPVFGKV